MLMFVQWYGVEGVVIHASSFLLYVFLSCDRETVLKRNTPEKVLLESGVALKSESSSTVLLWRFKVVIGCEYAASGSRSDGMMVVGACTSSG